LSTLFNNITKEITMSLILRNKCEEVLEEFQLGDYHARVNDNNNLVVVGVCGKPLFSISGIKFSRSVPSIIEIKFAVDLLRDFCAAHSEAITNVISTKAALIKAKTYEERSNYMVDVQNKSITYTFGDSVKLKYTPGTGVMEIIGHGYYDQEITVEDLKLLASVKLRKDMEQELAVAEVYDVVVQAHADALKVLTTCNI